jgi:tRNA-splicing ligase RtcB
MPIGGVIRYRDAISPSGVGYDIACGNKAVRTNLNLDDFGGPGGDGPYQLGMSPSWEHRMIKPFMQQIQKTVSFGIGRSSGENVDHPLFDYPVWSEIDRQFGDGLKHKARQQLGTVGSGNHYVDVLVDESGDIWVANHFGSRGLGHTIASGFMAASAGNDFTARVKEGPSVISTDTDLGAFYIEAMRLAGDYAYAGRDYVADQVVRILGATVEEEIHNHHNFAWLEDGLWAVRKGATPLTRDLAFIGGSMGDVSVIVRGKHDPLVVNDELTLDIGALRSAPHGAGRTMSRTKAAGKLRKMWYCNNRNCEFKPFRGEHGNSTSGYPGGKCPECTLPLRKGRIRDTSEAVIDWPSVRQLLEQNGIVVLGAGADEAPGVYKDLRSVLASHPNIEVVHELHPIGVVMAGADEFDPYKD